ncbi:MAG: hypothetical protein JSS60_09485 [Verrucomicrobia bacterium]|nr:hypothetical protein [Verrucomicrobiota bacterium]
MSMRIQDALSNCCEGIKDFASSAASWIGKTVSAAGTYISETVSKVAEFVKPHFESLKTFAQENRQSIIIAAVAFAVGAVATAIITNVFCRGTNTTPPVTTAGPTAATTV